MARLFISQAQMDKWTSDGKVTLDVDVMVLPAMSRSFRLQTAVHFTKLIDGEDTLDLLGRVKSEEQLATLSAEHYAASVIIGDVAYECEEGFLGEPLEAHGALGLNKME